MLLSHRHHHVHTHEIAVIRGLALLTLVTALSLLAAGNLHGAANRNRPKEQPLPTAVNDGFDALTLWQVLKSHRADDLREAIAGWQNIPLPAESEVWRQVALRAAQLESGKLEQATQNLAAAEKSDGKNPIVHYFLGMWRLEQASRALDYYDVIGMDSTQLVDQMLLFNEFDARRVILKALKQPGAGIRYP